MAVKIEVLANCDYFIIVILAAWRCCYTEFRRCVINCIVNSFFQHQFD